MLSILSNLFRRPWTPASPRPLHPSARTAPLPRAGAPAAAREAGAAACPTTAIDPASGRIDLGRCVVCGHCAAAAPEAFSPGEKVLLSSSSRAALVVGEDGLGAEAKRTPERLLGLAAGMRRALGRSIHVREVDAGSCNGCDWEIVSLTGPDWDHQRYGIDFVASPRHADLLLVTGPPSRQMYAALRETYDAMPEPRLVVATGACAISGGVFAGSYAALSGVAEAIPVDVFVPGCPPRPEAILEGILLAAGRKFLYSTTGKM